MCGYGNKLLPYLRQKVGGIMEHRKEWRTCDRCGAEIKKGILCGNSITKNGILNVTYDLCCKCMEDFERFMSNEHDRSN